MIRVATTDDPVAELRAAVTLAPDDLVSLRAAGIRLTLLGLATEALPLLDRAVTLEPRVRGWIESAAAQAHADGNPHAADLAAWLER